MQLEVKTQNRVSRIILRVECQKVSADETPSRVFDTSFQSKPVRTEQLNALFFLRFGNARNDVIEVSWK